jgi:hypothetical protein
MFRYIRFILVGIFITGIWSCSTPIKPSELPASIKVGDHYYTQVVIQYEKGAHVTTNYRRGSKIPINSEVILSEITNKIIKVKLVSDQKELIIKNVIKHTNDDTIQAFEKLFNKNKVNLDQFTALEREHIKSGTVAVGMRKKAVIAAIGFPPQIATMNLDANQWTYWSSKFNKFTVDFKNDKVSKVVD